MRPSLLLLATIGAAQLTTRSLAQEAPSDTASAASSESSPTIAKREGASNTQQAGPASASVDNIVVLARRRIKTPTSILILIPMFKQVQFGRQQVNSIADPLRIAPSLSVNTASGQSTVVGGVTRGVGQGNISTPGLFDVAQIRILTGPQATLFEPTTSTGLTHITTNAPDVTPYSLRLCMESSDAGAFSSIYGQGVPQAMANVLISYDAAVRKTATGSIRQGAHRHTVTPYAIVSTPSAGWCIEGARVGSRPTPAEQSVSKY